MSIRNRFRELWPVTLLYVALTIAFAYPLSVRPGSVLFGDNPDTHLFMWTLAWDVHALVTQPLRLFDANIYHPNSLTLAYSENLLGLALMVAPVLWLTHNPVLAINVAALLSCVLCGLGAYVLARRLGLSRPAAVICGLIFAFSPPRFVRNGQLHVGAVQWIPFTLAFLHSYLDGGRRRDLRLALFFYSLQAITSGHGAVFLTLSLAALLLFRVGLGERLNLSQRARDIGVTGAILLLPAVLIYLPYARVRAEMGFRRDLEPWNPTLTSFVAAPVHLHTWFLSSVLGAHPNETAHTYLFPGYLPLLLALAALLWWRRRPSSAASVLSTAALRRNPTLFYLLFTLFWVGLLLPPAVGLWPHLYWLPGLNQIRAAGRFAVMVVLGVAVLAAIGFERLTLRANTSNRRIAGWIAGCWLVVEFAGMPIPVEPFAPRFASVDRWLATQDGEFAIAEFPVRPPARYQSLYILHSTVHWKKTIHGYSGYEAPWHTQLYHELRSFPDALSIQRLREYGVTYAVVHTTDYSPEEWQAFEAKMVEFAGQLTPAFSGPDGRVYRVHERPERQP